MSYEDLKIQYRGFHPQEDIQSLVEESMDYVLSLAPFGSRLEANIEQTDDLLTGFVSIKSSVGPFFCHSSNTNLVALTEDLVIKMSKNLNKWKAKRFNATNMGGWSEAKVI